MSDNSTPRARKWLPIVLGAAGFAVFAGVAWFVYPDAAPEPVVAPKAGAPVAAVTPAPVVAPVAAPVPMAPKPAVVAVPPPPAVTVAPVAPPVVSAAPPPVVAVAKPAPVVVPPSFDIVRVNPDGMVVVAGRAMAGAAVTLRDNGADLAQGTADVAGQFVMTPAAPIAPGAHELSLLAQLGSAAAVPGVAPAVVVVPARVVAQAAAPSPPVSAPIAVVTSPTEAPRVVQAPPVVAAGVSLDVVDYDAAGHIRFGGRAAAGRVVRVYVDNAKLGDALSDAAGGWGLVATAAIPEGDHTLRVDLLGEGGGPVEARVEQPFHRAAVKAVVEAVPSTVVQPGQSLWRIARQSYGQGIRYTEIFAANRGQIRDPNLIYPGQVFSLPGATPSSANTSR